MGFAWGSRFMGSFDLSVLYNNTCRVTAGSVLRRGAMALSFQRRRLLLAVLGQAQGGKKDFRAITRGPHHIRRVPPLLEEKENEGKRYFYYDRNLLEMKEKE